jgi:class 3 adenylate cyclase
MVPPHEQLRLRFGLNCGETMVDADGDRHGNAVNVAFRLEGVQEDQRSEGSERRESLRSEDRVYITAGMYVELPPAAQAVCRPLGHFTFKGIAEPQLLYEVQWESVDCAVLGL